MIIRTNGTSLNTSKTYEMNPNSSFNLIKSYLDFVVVYFVQNLLGFVFSGPVSQQLREAERVSRPVCEQLDDDAPGCSKKLNV